jgi:hypothetical protein
MMCKIPMFQSTLLVMFVFVTVFISSSLSFELLNLLKWIRSLSFCSWLFVVFIVSYFPSNTDVYVLRCYSRLVGFYSGVCIITMVILLLVSSCFTLTFTFTLSLAYYLIAGENSQAYLFINGKLLRVYEVGCVCCL